MSDLNRLFFVVIFAFLHACDQGGNQRSQYEKTSYLKEFYENSNIKVNHFPGGLLLENETDALTVNSCSEYMSSMSMYDLVESDENMRMFFYYLPCISVALQEMSKSSDISFFEGDMSHVIINELDLATFRSSFRRNIGANNTFKSLGYDYDYVGRKVTINQSNWNYEFILLGKGDYNADGVEQLLVLFVDQANSSSYYASNLFVLNKKNKHHLWNAVDVGEYLD